MAEDSIATEQIKRCRRQVDFALAAALISTLFTFYIAYLVLGFGEMVVDLQEKVLILQERTRIHGSESASTTKPVDSRGDGGL